MTTTWNIVDNLLGNNFKDIGQYAVLVLNRPIVIHEDFVTGIWNEASFRATADGGTDRWYDFVASMKDKSKLNKPHPDLVSGDFDSVRPVTLQYCKDNCVNVVETPDQDNTDFTKALHEIIKHSQKTIVSVIVLVEHSGRLDQTLSNINTLFTFLSSSVSVFLMASDSITWLLNPGVHRVHIPQSLVQAEATCGLVPFGAPRLTKTSGLKWDLDNIAMEFGGLISTSNTYSKSCEGVVTIETDCALLWTVNFIEGFDNI